MRKSSPLCCDANIVVRLVTKADDVVVHDLFERWRLEGRRLVAPSLFRFELTNALYQLHRANILSDVAARGALQAALQLPVEFLGDDQMHQRAADLAARFNRPAAYDAHYLALSESIQAEFWTADERLYNAVRHELPWVHLVGP
jgi:predicted nucleic acid-binding protein